MGHPRVSVWWQARSRPAAILLTAAISFTACSFSYEEADARADSSAALDAPVPPDTTTDQRLDQGSVDRGSIDRGATVDQGPLDQWAADCGNCSPGQSCVGGECVCGAECPGCCAGDLCQALPPPGYCGTNGKDCVKCDPAATDGCSANGACACGSGQPCPDKLDCINGQCKCIANGRCDGCCENDLCQPIPASWPLCGVNGSTCVTCDPLTASGCHLTLGQCYCNPVSNVPACLPSEVCQGGVCKPL